MIVCMADWHWGSTELGVDGEIQSGVVFDLVNWPMSIDFHNSLYREHIAQ